MDKHLSSAPGPHPTHPPPPPQPTTTPPQQTPQPPQPQPPPGSDRVRDPSLFVKCSCEAWTSPASDPQLVESHGDDGGGGCVHGGAMNSSPSAWPWALQHITVRSSAPPHRDRRQAPGPGRVRCSSRTTLHGIPNTPNPGVRRGSLAEPAPQGSDRSLRRSSLVCLPQLALPSLAGAASEAVDSSSLRFLAGPEWPCSLLSFTGLRCSASWTLWTRKDCIALFFWQWHVQGLFAGILHLALCSSCGCQAHDAPHHGRKETQGLLCTTTGACGSDCSKTVDFPKFYYSPSSSSTLRRGSSTWSLRP